MTTRTRAFESPHELEEQLRFEQLLLELSARFVNPPADQCERRIQQSLKAIVEFLGVNRVNLWRYDAKQERFDVLHGEASDASEALPRQRMKRSDLPWITKQVLNDRIVKYTSHHELPEAASDDVETMKTLGTRSLLVIPLASVGEVLGAISFGTTREHVQWPSMLIQRLSIIADIFAAALERKRLDDHLQHLRSQLAHINRIFAVSEMAGAVAHEINQPLSAILSNAQAALRFLDREEPELDEVRECLQDIVADDKRAGEIVKGLRRFMKKQDGRWGLIQPARLIDEVVELLQGELQYHGVLLEVDFEPDLPAVRGDRVQLMQVLVNLVKNAIEALEQIPREQRRMALRLGRRGDGVQVTVSDCGPGIPADERSRVFEPFFTTKREGMGVGLAINRSIVEAHGGQIWLEDRVTEGACFHFTLPAASTDEGPAVNE